MFENRARDHLQTCWLVHSSRNEAVKKNQTPPGSKTTKHEKTKNDKDIKIENVLWNRAVWELQSWEYACRNILKVIRVLDRSRDWFITKNDVQRRGHLPVYPPYFMRGTWWSQELQFTAWGRDGFRMSSRLFEWWSTHKSLEHPSTPSNILQTPLNTHNTNLPCFGHVLVMVWGWFFNIIQSNAKSTKR